MKINGDRLWASLMELAQIGATEKGGVKRLALTDLDKQGRDLVVGWAKDAGLSITIDQIGNVFMRRDGTNNALPPVMTGSHIDTQPTGGKFDGNYGVLAGLEVVRTLNDLKIKTEAPIEVAFWTNEEGSRFVPVMMGSGVFAKAFTLEHAYAATDTTGVSVKEELARIGHPTVDIIVSLTQSDAHFDQIVEAIAPQGQFALIDDPVSLDVTKLKRKSVSLHWELMFTRALFGTDDMIGQHRLLTEVAQLVDAGLIRTTLDQRFGTINAENLKRAHALIESGKARGKLVLEGWA